MKALCENKPTADVLMNSMRAMGYSFESAVADIIDNSISADAKNIKLFFPIDPLDCYIAICDDGFGMTEEELFDAMKYGSESKRAGRDENDLGRFGLGLKAASLSQCRKLTVASKKNGIVSAFSWDLDVIEENKEWLMVNISSDVDRIKQIDFLEKLTSGTIVVWECFDLIHKASNGRVYAELSKYQESVANYLSLIFHRFLNKKGAEKLHISINNFQLEGLDPFLENHNKTNVRRLIQLPVEDSQGIERMVLVQPYVLPFQKDLSADDKKLSGGIENYRSNQGYYIYRNERLIIWGNWFGRHRDELTKHARVRVDIPNTLDDIWGIDIKKQNATIPVSIRQKLNRAVDDVMDVAVKAQKYRGRTDVSDESIDYIWLPIKTREEQHVFQINRESKIFDFIKDQVSDAVWAKLEIVLEEIENNLPYQQIYIDKAQNHIDDTVTDERLNDIEDKARMLISMAVMMGEKTKKEIIDSLFLSEPFNKYPEIKQRLLEN